MMFGFPIEGTNYSLPRWSESSDLTNDRGAFRLKQKKTNKCTFVKVFITDKMVVARDENKVGKMITPSSLLVVQKLNGTRLFC